MTAAATTRSTTGRSPWPQKSHHKSSTTPHTLPTAARTPASVGQSAPPRLSPNARSPVKQSDPSASSPNYFGLVVEGGGNPTDSNAGQHAKKNWKSPSSSVQSKISAASPQPVPHEANPEYEEFRKQSEGYAFNLSQRGFSGLGKGPLLSPGSPLSKEPLRPDGPSRTSSRWKSSLSGRDQKEPAHDAMEIDSRPTGPARQPSSTLDPGSFFDIPRNESPMTLTQSPATHTDYLSHIDERHPRLSLPQSRVHVASPPLNVEARRAETLPSAMRTDGPMMIAPDNLLELLQRIRPDKILLLDLRVSPQYAQSRLQGALNLCIPTTLLKRPSFDSQRLADTFTNEEEKAKFSRWREMEYVVVYDSNSQTLKDALSSVNTLKKFTNEGWRGAAFVIRGGFKEVSQSLPQLIEKTGSGEGDAGRGLSLNSGSDAMPVAGGCPMPSTRTAANPFFGNIRQNMDLIGGVGQMPIKLPEVLGARGFNALPQWLRRAAGEEDKGKAVSDHFLHIEKEEQQRMQTALSGNVSYGTPRPDLATIQVAGIEKGTKNRYKDMLPYDHSRVRLQNVPSGECDYINASHVKTKWSHRHYIATQAPVPTTFEDFWRLVWEQEARVIVMLSAETEGGQRKCHPYWLNDSYGQMKVKSLSEKRVSLHPPTTLAANFKRSQLSSPLEKPSPSRRRATNPHGTVGQEGGRDDPAPESSETPHVVVRKLTLSHSAFPFQPMREITQIHYSQWPDFGAPAHATDVLGVVEHCNTVARHYSEQQKSSPLLPTQENEPPIVVHCSAGCGRTGTFCTIDSVIDMLKTQRMAQLKGPKNIFSGDEMEVDSDNWELHDDIDFIGKAVEEFRLQRLSMVQTLRQYVLCYESVLEWLVKEIPEKFRRETLRRSFNG